MQSPIVDPRSRAELAEQTRALVERFTAWRADPAGPPDPGDALVSVFAHFAGLVVDRLNALPVKNLTAFLGLIGAEPLPPEAARVPITFGLVEGAPADALVPAGTEVAAPATSAGVGEVRYATEHELLVTRARAVGAHVVDPWTDRTADRTGLVQAAPGEPGTLFLGDGPAAHELYVACEPLLADAAGRSVRVSLASPDRAAWETWPVSWSAWDGRAWAPLAASGRYDATAGRWDVTLGPLPELAPVDVGGTVARWLRARLERPLPPARHGLAPDEAGPVVVDRPGTVALPATPFADGAAEWFVDGGLAFGWAGSIAELDLVLATAGKARRGLRLAWEYLADGGAWKPFAPAQPVAGAATVDDGTAALTQSGTVRLRVPDDWTWEDWDARRGRWLRVGVVAGSYTTAPVVDRIAFGWDWELPTVRSVGVTVLPAAGAGSAGAAVAPELAVVGAARADVTRDLAPFGSAPVYDDVFLVACEPVLAAAGAVVEVALTMTNGVGQANPPVPAVLTTGNPTVAWEMPTATGWRALVTSPAAVPPGGGAASLTATGTVSFTVPTDVAVATVQGEARHWLRLRLVGGNYGEAARYAAGPSGGFTPVAATYAPPRLRSVRLRVVQAPAAAGATVPVPASACVTVAGGVAVDRTASVAGGGAAFPAFEPVDVAEPTLFLGFDRPFGPRPYAIWLQVEPPDASELVVVDAADGPLRARAVWEHEAPDGWVELGPLDETAGLTRPGLVRFVGPETHPAATRFGREAHWFALRWRGGAQPFVARARHLCLNTAWASAATVTTGEVLGSSTGEPGQRFPVTHTPVLRGERLEVRETATAGGAWEAWEPVADFNGSGPDDRHYTIDRTLGVVRFGDGHRGRIPPPGAAGVRMARYRWGGGADGNRAAGEVVELKTGLPYIASVVNHAPASGGFDGEAVERVMERGPAMLRHRDRAVTARDLEDLAYGASPEVARVAVITPDFDAGQLWLRRGEAPAADHRDVTAGRVGVVVVPGAAVPRPTPTLQLLEQVRRHLAERGSATADVWAAGPHWVPVSVEVRVVPVDVHRPDALTGDVRRALDGFLHPLTGGPAGRGWAFGAVPRRSGLHRLLEALPGVDHVRSLRLELAPEADVADRGPLAAWLARRVDQTTALDPAERHLHDWARRALVTTGSHDVRVVLDD